MPDINQTDFEPHSLNQKIWDGKKLRPIVRKQMLRASRAFIDEFDVDIQAVKDITFTGSMAGFYWTVGSDIDLHILVSFDEMDDSNEMIRDYYDLAKIVWGKNFEQFICGHEVELYVQDVDQPHHASGVYSVLNNKWLKTPEKFDDVEIDTNYIEYRLKYLRRKIKYAEYMVKHEPDAAMKYIDKLQDKIKKMRQNGLDASGEMSLDNLTFKTMRRDGLLDELRSLYKKAYTFDMSLNCNGR